MTDNQIESKCASCHKNKTCLLMKRSAGIREVYCDILKSAKIRHEMDNSVLEFLSKSPFHWYSCPIGDANSGICPFIKLRQSSLQAYCPIHRRLARKALTRRQCEPLASIKIAPDLLRPLQRSQYN